MASQAPMLSISTKAQYGAATSPGLGLTPPVTPTIEDRNVSESTNNSLITTTPVSGAAPGEQTAAVQSPPQFLDELEYQHDDEGRRISFGSGAWSVVYKAFASPRANIATRPLTPPSSPTTKGRLVAVKSPGRRDARPVLYAEALALTRASAVPDSEHYIVPFHGYIAESSSIIMSAIPLSLSSYIEDKARLAQQNFSTRTMFDPVLGMAQWHDCARKLIKCLSWLHDDAKIVHGDIKPHNILLQPLASLNSDSSTEFPYEPLLIDFSSSYSVTDEKKPAGTSLSAVTPPFTAPELLASLSSPDVIPAPPSDVFSLAVTILAAATGDLLIYSGFNAGQRLMRAKDGHMIIDFARSSNNGTRVPKNGLVEKLVKPAVAKDPAVRITPREWLELASE
ncbi:kinase-like domain-containing protein [Aspergillus unguis]